jgi:hypothetical protein
MPSYAPAKKTPEHPRGPRPPQPVGLMWLERHAQCTAMIRHTLTMKNLPMQAAGHLETALAHLALAKTLKTARGYRETIRDAFREIGYAFRCIDPKDNDR